MTTNVAELKHNVPEIVKLEPNAVHEALLMKEVKLPFADQTHEVCWEPVTQHVFVTQMSNSSLVRIAVDKNGMLLDKVEAWRIGPEDGGLHNAGLSHKYPGCLWLSIQYLNLLMLVDVRPENFLEVKNIIQVPSMLKKDCGDVVHVGGPHCVRECPVTGNIWACLKGALEDFKNNNPCGKLSVCCDPVLLREKMELHSKNPEFDIKIPDGYAVWQLDPKDYDPNSPCGMKGGKLYECLKSPPMLALDSKGNAWCAQDQEATMMYIDQEKKVAEQLQVPWPKDAKVSEKHTGPGIATAPDGSIWMTQLETMSSLVRIDPETKERVLYDIEAPEWARGIRMIHLTCQQPKDPAHHNRIYAISSTLLQDESTDALFIMSMCNDWKTIEGIRIVPLPSQGSACHRIVYAEIEDGDNEKDDGSVFITELTLSKLLQIKVNDDVAMHTVEETIEKGPTGFEHRLYKMNDETYFGRCPTKKD